MTTLFPFRSTVVVPSGGHATWPQDRMPKYKGDRFPANSAQLGAAVVLIQGRGSALNFAAYPRNGSASKLPGPISTSQKATRRLQHCRVPHLFFWPFIRLRVKTNQQSFSKPPFCNLPGFVQTLFPDYWFYWRGLLFLHRLCRPAENQ